MPGTPWVIDQQAFVTAQQSRLLAHMAVQGQQGVLGSTHLRVGQQVTPAASVLVYPGAFSILNTGVGGEFEAYVAKFSTAETLSVTPTAAAARTDLVIARVENPWAVGTGSWAIPADPINGPYWHIRVIEGVTPSNIPDVKSWNGTWSAIPLARITRPANTGIVTDAHITDLRALVDLSGERITNVYNHTTQVNTTPPVPPVAQQVWTGTLHLPTVTTLARTQSAWIDWPAAATFQMPVPTWAREADILGAFNPQYDGDVYGEVRLAVGGVNSPAIVFDRNTSGGWQRENIPLVGNMAIPESLRGKVVTVQLQAHMLDPTNHDGTLKTRTGVYLGLQFNFKRAPGA